MRSALFILAAAVLLGIVANAPQAAPASGPQSIPDLYNLGVIGGKADLAGETAGAKSALVVHDLPADCPATNAGLKVADVIYGVAGKPFGEGAYLELAGAIQDAESQTAADKAVVKLMIKRGAEQKEISISLTADGDDAGKGEVQPGDKLRKDLVEKAAAWLARQQDSDGKFPTTMSVENGLVVLTSIAGLALMASGSTAEKGKYSDNITSAAKFVMATVGVQKKYRVIDGKNFDQTNWSLGYGGIFLAHVYKSVDQKWLGKSPLRSIRSKLEWVRDRIFANMEDNGGFPAGPGGLNALGYIEFEAESNFCLAAIGCIKACGLKVDDKLLTKALDYVRACAGEDGGIAYSTRPMEKEDFQIGRTAAAANVFASLGLSEDKLYPLMQKYVHERVDQAFTGHSTPTMHELSVAMASWRGGPEMWNDYWKANRREFTMVRQPDGAFSYRPTEDTLRMQMNIDRNLTNVWTTAQWLLVLQLPDGAIPLWVAKAK